MINAEEARAIAGRAIARLNKEASLKADNEMEAINVLILKQCDAGRKEAVYSTTDLELACEVYKRLRKLDYSCSETKHYTQTQHLTITW